VLLAEGFAINGPLDVRIAARSLGRLEEARLAVTVLVKPVGATASVLGGDSLAHFEVGVRNLVRCTGKVEMNKVNKSGSGLF